MMFIVVKDSFPIAGVESLGSGFSFSFLAFGNYPT